MKNEMPRKIEVGSVNSISQKYLGQLKDEPGEVHIIVDDSGNIHMIHNDFIFKKPGRLIQESGTIGQGNCDFCSQDNTDGYILHYDTSLGDDWALCQKCGENIKSASDPFQKLVMLSIKHQLK